MNTSSSSFVSPLMEVNPKTIKNRKFAACFSHDRYTLLKIILYVQ